jgi:hypothetical protein
MALLPYSINQNEAVELLHESSEYFPLGAMLPSVPANHSQHYRDCGGSSRVRHRCGSFPNDPYEENPALPGSPSTSGEGVRG